MKIFITTIILIVFGHQSFASTDVSDLSDSSIEKSKSIETANNKNSNVFYQFLKEHHQISNPSELLAYLQSIRTPSQNKTTNSDFDYFVERLTEASSKDSISESLDDFRTTFDIKSVSSFDGQGDSRVRKGFVVRVKVKTLIICNPSSYVAFLVIEKDQLRYDFSYDEKMYRARIPCF